MPEYCSHIAIMSQGKMLRFGTVAEIAHQTDESRRRYTIQLARHVPNIAAYFNNITGVSDVQAEGERIVCEYLADAESAANLLTQLVQQQLPVSAFSPHAADLEEAYMRSGVGQVD
jgi:ABC-type multidrug transport system ATPase subunit